MDVGAKSVLAGRYELGSYLGHGGMANVRAAHDRLLDRPVAVKIFNPVGWNSAEGRTRFELEAKLAASVVHPNVVTVYGVGVEEDVPFLVMECLPGTTLADEIRSGPLSEARVRQIGGDVLDALATAHALGVLHRDLKPANVLLTSDDRPKITDFGIATSDTVTELTATGLVIGTPAYLAPERVAGKSATAQSDIYSVGVLCYEAATGGRPFAGDSPVAVAYSILHDDPKPVRAVRPDLSPHFEAVVTRAMARDPRDRFESAADFRDALAVDDARVDADATMPIAALATRVLPVPPTFTPRRSRRPLVAIVAIAALMLAVGFLASAHSSPLPTVPRQPVSATTNVTQPPPTRPPTTLAPAPPPPRGHGPGHGKGHGKGGGDGNDQGD